MFLRNFVRKNLIVFVSLVVVYTLCYGEEEPSKIDRELKMKKAKIEKIMKRKDERLSRIGPLIVTYDYQTGEFFTNIKKKNGLDKYVVWFRQNVTLKVINVNPFLFKTTITGTGHDYFTDLPIGFSEIYKEGMGMKEKPKSSTEVKKTTKETKQNVKEENLKSVKASKEIPKNKKEKRNTKLNEITNSKFDVIDEFINSYEKIIKINKFDEMLPGILFKDKKYVELRSDLDKIIISFWGNKMKIDLLRSEFQKMQDDAKHRYNKIDFKFLEKKKCDGVKGVDKLITQIKGCKKSLDEFEKNKIISQIVDLLEKFQPEKFEKSLLIPTVESDEVQFKVSIESLDKTKYEVRNIVQDSIIIRVKRGWVINFSTGVLFHWNAHDRTYSLVPLEGNPEKMIIRENENKNSITPSIAALMHVYPRSVRSVKWGGILFGIGTNDTERINYYIGTSYMFGFKKRFIVNLGATITKINVLKPKFENGQEIDADSDLTSDDLVHREFKVRLFIGFTYNLTK